eukprot:1158904-Pelagomonas_calceolata.AAC.12
MSESGLSINTPQAASCACCLGCFTYACAQNKAWHLENISGTVEPMDARTKYTAESTSSWGHLDALPTNTNYTVTFTVTFTRGPECSRGADAVQSMIGPRSMPSLLLSQLSSPKISEDRGSLRREVNSKVLLTSVNLPLKAPFPLPRGPGLNILPHAMELVVAFGKVLSLGMPSRASRLLAYTTSCVWTRCARRIIGPSTSTKVQKENRAARPSP